MNDNTFPTIPSEVPAMQVKQKPIRRGRRSTHPTTDLGRFIQQRLDFMNMTRVQFAKRLRISPSTVGRLLNGDTQVVQRVSAQNICEALELNDMDRRTFLQIIGAATTTTFALATGTTAPKTSRYKLDLDLADDYADALSRLLNEGEAEYVRESAQRWYSKLLQEPLPAKDTRLGAVQIRFGMLLGQAQEFTLPWEQRNRVAIQTYTSIEANVIHRFELNTFRHEYTLLLSHRAPLYRAIGRFNESSKEFEDAIGWVKAVDDPQLRANLFRSRIHVKAVQGDELQWARQLEEARKDGSRMDTAHNEEILSMLNYVEGEGYKRFAFNPHKELPVHIRIEYAHRALQSFAIVHNSREQQNMPQSLLMQVSEAQCLIWIDPVEAILRLQQLRILAERFFPALIGKINKASVFAQKMIKSRKSDFPLRFNLDAKFSK